MNGALSSGRCHLTRTLPARLFDALKFPSAAPAVAPTAVVSVELDGSEECGAYRLDRRIARVLSEAADTESLGWNNPRG